MKTYRELLEFLQKLSDQDLDSPMALEEGGVPPDKVSIHVADMDSFSREYQLPDTRMVMQVNYLAE